MTDTREQILSALFDLLGRVNGVTYLYRNRGEIPDDKLPAAVLLDGVEVLKTVITGHSFVQMPVSVFTLLPQIFILTKPRDDVSNETLAGAAAPIGPELSAYRIKVIDAVLHDDVLVNLIGPNGQIEYRRCDTDMQTGSTMVGVLQFHFAISYVFDPNDL